MKTPKKNSLDRRGFLELSIQGSIGISLAACSSLPLSGCKNNEIKTIYGACYHDCPDRCSWEITIDDSKLIDFNASEDNPFTNGRLCEKMMDFPNDVTYNPDRLLTPLKRVGKKGEGKFEPISWDLAISEVAHKVNLIIAEYGGQAIMPYKFAGNQGLIQGKTISDRFFAHIGATNVERTICGDTAVSGILAVNGQTTGVLPEDIVHSKYIILWGTNTINSNQHLWPFIQIARDNGSKLVVIDPYKSATAKEADWHVQLKPGSDTALALGMINVILEKGLQDQDYIEKYTIGITELKNHTLKYTPDIVASITGISIDNIILLSEEYAKASPSIIRCLIGMEHQANGASAFRSLAMLPAITGAWRKLGGGLMSMTYELFGEALNWQKIELTSSISKEAGRTVNMIKLGEVLNDKSMAPPIKGIFVFNSNPLVTTPNQNLIKRGMEREDLLTVVLEHFMTDTARYADYVFPATTVLENWDILDSWGSVYLNINQPAIQPLGQSKPNNEFFRLLSKEMKFDEPYLFEDDLKMVKSIIDSDHEYMNGITFESLSKKGWGKLNIPRPWLPHARGNFNTTTGKCMFHNPEIEPPLPDYIANNENEDLDYPFQLLSVKSPKYFLNSSHANVAHLIEREGAPCIDINEIDAYAKGISNGDKVRVFNQRGEIIVLAKLSGKVLSGVVSVPQGYWASLSENGSSVNALTTDAFTDMGKGAAFHETWVDIERI